MPNQGNVPTSKPNVATATANDAFGESSDDLPF